MKVYLAAQIARREEVARYAEQLRMLDIEVPSRWLLGKHEAADGMPSRWAEFGLDDLEDMVAADVIVSFTEPVGTVGPMRGGRHVEHGIMTGLRRRAITVGYQENVFHYLPWAEHYDGWTQAMSALSQRCRSCRAHIRWALTRDKRMPLDAVPVATGTYWIETGFLRDSTIATGPLAPPLYTSHFATCPDAKMWRKR